MTIYYHFFYFKLLSHLTFLVSVLYSIGLKSTSHDSNDSKFGFAFRAINLGKFVGNDNSLWITNNLYEEGTLWKQPVQKIIL